jgi:hypothetical protein
MATALFVIQILGFALWGYELPTGGGAWLHVQSDVWPVWIDYDGTYLNAAPADKSLREPGKRRLYLPIEYRNFAVRIRMCPSEMAGELSV